MLVMSYRWTERPALPCFILLGDKDVQLTLQKGQLALIWCLSPALT